MNNKKYININFNYFKKFKIYISNLIKIKKECKMNLLQKNQKLNNKDYNYIQNFKNYEA